ncbi:MAG TPA: radical SAM protein [Candidatus Ozemobacteraceae bacterium]|nr:radical SAM protein [Candidatus Ozemobacteraceae bacterium]
MARNFRVLFIYPNTEMATLVPINLSLLSACLKQASIDVELFDTTYYHSEEVNFEQKKVELLQLKPFSYSDKGVSYLETDMFQDLKKRVNDFQPDLIGITLVEDTWELGKSLVAAIADYQRPVIAGGVFVSFSPEETIQNPNIDMICIGEGEGALVELCQKMRAGEDTTGIRNLWVKKNGQLFKNPMRPVTDLATLPVIDYDIFDRKRLYRPMQGKVYSMIHVELDRGCPYSCTYCEAPQLRKLFQENGCGNYYRRKTPDQIFAELRQLIDKYKPDYINFNAESFLAKPLGELQELASRYASIRIPFWCQSRPETVTEEKIRILKEMNCQNMQFGIEHGNEEFRERMLNRTYTNAQMIEGFRIVEDVGIAYTVNNIIGFPEETRELVFDTIAVNREIKPATANVYLFTPYKGTTLYQYCLEKGYISSEDRVHQVLDSVPLRHQSISYQELKGLQRTFPLYSRFPESRFPEIRRAEIFDEEGNRSFERLRNEYMEKFFGIPHK